MAWQLKKLMASVILAAFAAGAAADDAEVGRARALLKDGKAVDAYRLLEPREFERAGEIAFDTVLGIAALDGGLPDKATLAFERVLALDPGAAGVRLDMARAYFALGDFARARQELAQLAAHSPPPAARVIIDSYLNALDERERRKRTALGGYLEAFVGHDDNITSVVGDFTSAVLATYNLPGFQPTGNAIKRGSGIAGLAGGVEVVHRHSDALTLFANADLRHRGVIDAGNYASDQLDLRGGASYALGADTLRGSLALQEFRQRTDVPSADRRALGVNLEWRRALGTHDQLSVLGAATRQRFADTPVNDVDTLAAGVGWLHLFEHARKPLLYAIAMGGRDDARNRLANGADNSRHFASARLYAQFALNEATDLFASAGQLQRDDRSPYARSSTVAHGRDRTADLTLGANWRPLPRWTVRPQVMHTENRSNVALSEYRRTEASVTVRYDWN